MEEVKANRRPDHFAHDHTLTPEQEKHYAELFTKLDVDGDGRIDATDLKEGLARMGVPHYPGHAQKLMMKSDRNEDGHVDFAEFVQYVLDHEKKLKLVFKNIDRNEDGHLDVHEILTSLEDLGVKVTKDEADKLLHRMKRTKCPTCGVATHIPVEGNVECVCIMDEDGSLKVSWDEWRNYLILHPSADLKDIYMYWRHATFLDIGEDVMVPDEFTEQEIKSGRWWRILVSGGAAGAVSRTVTAPLDRLKVILQVIGSKKPHISIVSGFKHMYREGGIRSFWRGNGINVVKIAPESAIKFVAYEQMKKLLHREGHELQAYQRFAAGSSAGVIAQTTIYPMEVLKTRLAIRKTGQYKGIVDCAFQVARQEGLRSFYRGYLPNVLGVIPYAGVDLAVYETLKNHWISRHEDQPVPGTMVLLGCGTVSSTCGQLSSYPLALVRTRLQARTTSHNSMVALFKTIYKDEGVRGLYRGITPNFMKVIPAVSIGYVVYENVRRMLGV